MTENSVGSGSETVSCTPTNACRGNPIETSSYLQIKIGGKLKLNQKCNNHSFGIQKLDCYYDI